jgi:hypothetical protein
MEAKPIAGEHRRFCGNAKAPLVKTPCCEQWICCDTAFLSFRGGGQDPLEGVFRHPILPLTSSMGSETVGVRTVSYKSTSALFSCCEIGMGVIYGMVTIAR